MRGYGAKIVARSARRRASLGWRERVPVIRPHLPACPRGRDCDAAGGGARAARFAASGAPACATRAGAEGVEPRIPVLAPESSTAGGDLPAVVDGSEIVAGEQPLSGRFRPLPQPANKAGPHLVFAGRAGSVDQNTVPSAHPRAGMVSSWTGVTAPVQLCLVCSVGGGVPGAQWVRGLLARMFPVRCRLEESAKVT